MRSSLSRAWTNFFLVILFLFAKGPTRGLAEQSGGSPDPHKSTIQIHAAELELPTEFYEPIPPPPQARSNLASRQLIDRFNGNGVDQYFDQLAAMLHNAQSELKDPNEFQVLADLKQAQRISREILSLISELQQFAELKESEFIERYGKEKGLTQFKKAIDADKIIIQNEIGKAELNSVDDQIVLIVKHRASNLSFICLDRSNINPRSAHLRQLLARQQQDAQKDPILYWSNGQIDLKARAKTPGAKISQYWYATHETTSWKQCLALGMTDGAFQAALGLTVGAASYFLQGKPFIYQASILSFIFGGVIGAKNSTYRHWLLREASTPLRTQAKIFAKAMTISLSFSYLLRMWLANDFNPAHLSGEVHGALWLNALINNHFRAQIAQFEGIRRKLRLNSGNVEFKGVKFKRSVLEARGSYLVQYVMKLSSILPGNELMGNTLFLVAAEVVRRLNVLYAERVGYPEAPALRRQWEKLPWGGPLEQSIKQRSPMPMLQACQAHLKSFVGFVRGR